MDEAPLETDIYLGSSLPHEERWFNGFAGDWYLDKEHQTIIYVFEGGATYGLLSSWLTRPEFKKRFGARIEEELNGSLHN